MVTRATCQYLNIRVGHDDNAGDDEDGDFQNSDNTDNRFKGQINIDVSTISNDTYKYEGYWIW